MTEKNSGLLVLLFLLLLLGSGPPARAQSTFPESTPDLSAQLIEHYQTVGAAFWQAEELRNAQTITPAQRKVLLTTPVPESHSSHQKYFQAATAADSFLKLADGNKVRNWMLDPVLYLGGLSHFSLGNYPRAKTLFSRLSPGYLRDYYINDRDPVNPEFSTPTKPGISKLIFYCQLKSLPKKPEDALATLKKITVEAQSTLAAQNEYAHWLANRKSVHDRREFSESYFGGQPDQIRASALPSTLELLETAWDGLLPEAVKKSNLPARDYLRTLIDSESTLSESTSQRTFITVSAPSVSLSLLASVKLQEIDARIIRSYFSQAQRQLKANNFDGARRYYRRIIEEYPRSESAQRAQAQLPKVIPVAVNYYQKVADENFRSTQIGVPQNKAAEYYEKMFKEDPDGPKADIALYYWARALGTAGKVKQEVQLLQRHLADFPESKMRSKAMYLLGFTYCNHLMRDYKRGVPILMKVAKEFPRSDEAPEALWHAAIVLGTTGQHRQAIPLLQQLKKRSPESKRASFADKWITKFSHE